MSLSETLDNIPCGSPFAVGGVFDEWMDYTGADEVEDPQLHITGVGHIKMPLAPKEADLIRGVAHRAPFGKGRDTILDLKTRKTWELDPDQVKIGNNEFNAAVAVLAQRTALKLGVPRDIKVGISLYKVLLYEPGDFFHPHRDTEKVPGMFATFTVSMRSKKVGGSTVVEHAGLRRIFDESEEEGGSEHYHYTMFFADCMHEVLKLEEGHRLVLVYNVYRKTKVASNQMPSAALNSLDAAYLAEIKASVQATLPLDTGDGNWKPSKRPFAYFLEHSYTDISGSFSQLKGADLTRFEYLRMLTVDIPFRMALASIDANLHYQGFTRSGEAELDESEVCSFLVDFMDASDEVDGWIEMGEMEDQFLEYLDAVDTKPFAVEREEYVGNSGPTESQEYHVLALVLYPIPLDAMIKTLGETDVVDDLSDPPPAPSRKGKRTSAAPTAASSSSSAKRQSKEHPSAAPPPKKPKHN